MLVQTTKKVTIAATSVVEIEGKKVVLENYNATVDSENPENMSMNRFSQLQKQRNYIKIIGRSAGQIIQHNRLEPMPCRMKCSLSWINKE